MSDNSYPKGILDRILEHEVWYGGDEEAFVLGDCRFLEDFGPWKKGHHADSMSLSFIYGTLTEFDNDGNKINEAMVKISLA